MLCYPLDNTEYEAEGLGLEHVTRTRGVYSADGNLSVSTGGGMNVTVSPGVCFLKMGPYWGVTCLQKDSLSLPIQTADGTLSRKDAVVARIDKVANIAEIVVKAGTPASSPALPAIVRDNDYDEIYLASVTVGAGVVEITADAISDLRLDESVCGLMADTAAKIPTDVYDAQIKAFLKRVESELNQLNSGTASMMRATYDPQGRQTDIFKAIDKVSNIYYARLTLGGWTACSSADQAKGLLYQQTATLTCANSHAPVVTAASEFLSGIGYDKTGVPATDDVLNEVQDIINDGVTVTAYNSVLVKVKEKPTAEIRARWVIQS